VTADSTRSTPRRAHVKVDKYAPVNLATRYDLKASEVWLLVVLALAADWRTAEWRGSLDDLALLSRMSRSTVAGTRSRPGVVPRLRDLGLVVMVEPFGPNREGVIYVAVYDDLVVPERRASPTMSRRAFASDDASREDPGSTEVASHSRRNRVTSAPDDASPHGVTSTDATPRSSEAVKEGRDLPRDNCEVPGCDALGEWENDHGGLVCEAHGRSQSADVLHERGAALFAARFDAEIVGEVERG
jgi:hypothetical protein